MALPKGALPKGLTGLCSSSAVVIGFNLAVSHTILKLVLVAYTYSIILSLFTELFHAIFQFFLSVLKNWHVHSLHSPSASSHARVA